MPKPLEKLTPHTDGKKRKMKMTSLTAIALTGKGANPHADVTFFKSVHPEDRKKKKKKTASAEKRYSLTGATDGHTHLVQVDPHTLIDMGGSTSWEDDHSHPFVISDTGTITIGDVDDHTHTLEGVAKEIIENGLTETQLIEKLFGPMSGNENAADIGGDPVHTEETTMPKEKDAEKLAKAKTEKLEKELVTAKALATLNDAEKNFYNGIDKAADKEVFLAKSSTERQVEIVESIEKDAVIYKASNGSIYRKSDDPRLAEMAKKIDDGAKDVALEKAKTEKLALEKRVNDEFPNLPGKVETRVALVKAIDSIAEEATRKEALEALKAQNTRMAKALDTYGTSRTPNTDEATVGKAAEVKMEDLTRKYMADKEMTDYFEAYEKVKALHPDTYEAAVTG